MLAFAVVTLVLAASGLVGAYVALMYSAQDGLVFPAPGGIDRMSLDATAAEIGAQPLELLAPDGARLYGWHRAAGGHRAILYLHGNAETVAGSSSLQDRVVRHGWDFVVVAYRGYPGSEGAPTQQSAVEDARVAWDFITNELGIPPERIVVHGRSLGGGVAVQLMSAVRPAGLVLESTFRSVLELARDRLPRGLPVEALLRHPFRSDLQAAQVAVPTLVLHSRADRTIPVDHGRWLAATIPDAMLLEAETAGHWVSLPVEHERIRQVYTEWIDRRAPVVEE